MTQRFVDGGAVVPEVAAAGDRRQHLLASAIDNLDHTSPTGFVEIRFQPYASGFVPLSIAEFSL